MNSRNFLYLFLGLVILGFHRLSQSDRKLAPLTETELIDNLNDESPTQESLNFAFHQVTENAEREPSDDESVAPNSLQPALEIINIEDARRLRLENTDAFVAKVQEALDKIPASDTVTRDAYLEELATVLPQQGEIISQLAINEIKNIRSSDEDANSSHNNARLERLLEIYYRSEVDPARLLNGAVDMALGVGDEKLKRQLTQSLTQRYPEMTEALAERLANDVPVTLSAQPEVQSPASRERYPSSSPEFSPDR